MNEKESIPAQFFQRHFHPRGRIWTWETLPKEPNIHKKYSEMSADMPNSSPHAGKKVNLATAAWLALVPAGAQSLAKL